MKSLVSYEMSVTVT